MTDSSSRRPQKLRPLVRGTLLGVLLLAGCASTTDRRERITKMMIDTRFRQALVEAADWAKEEPGNPAAVETHKRATAAWLMDRAQTALFDDRDEEALEYLEQAAQLLPDSEIVQQWLDKANRKLADRWIDVGTTAAVGGELPAAEQAFEKALTYVPGDVAAKEGLSRVLLRLNYREGLGLEYYKQGVRALRDFWLSQASADFERTLKYLPEHEAADLRRAEVDHLEAEDRVQKAEDLFEAGLFSAARNEYRLALLLDEDHAAALEGMERAEREAKAAEQLRKAEWLVYRDRFDEADETLRLGAELTVSQSDEFARQRATLQDAHFQRKYDAAYELELDAQYEEAIEAYQELLAEAGHFEDVEQRVSTLQDFIRQAERFYAMALDADTRDEEERYLRFITQFWPEYKDVRTRLAEIQRQRMIEEAAEAAPVEAPSDEDMPSEAPEEGSSQDG